MAMDGLLDILGGWTWWIVAGLLLNALPGQAAGLVGKWTAEFETPVGQVKYLFDVVVTGDRITGKASFDRIGLGQKGQVGLLEGKLTGDEVFFVEMLDMMGTPVHVEYRGTLKGAHRAKAQ
jgi:hypothetical protein